MKLFVFTYCQALLPVRLEFASILFCLIIFVVKTFYRNFKCENCLNLSRQVSMTITLRITLNKGAISEAINKSPGLSLSSTKLEGNISKEHTAHFLKISCHRL